MIDLITSKLSKVQPKGNNSYMACCPAHEDNTPSLAVTELPDGRILMKCFAGCGLTDVLAAIGLTISDLFPDGGLGHFKGWQQLQEEQANGKRQKQEDRLFREKVVLATAETDRKSGKRLSAEDLKREQLAYWRIRNANNQ